MADPVDSIGALKSHQQRMTRAKNKVQEEESRWILERQKVEKKGRHETEKARERTKHEVEQAQKTGEKELRRVKDLNLQNLQRLNKMNEQKIDAIAADTRKRIEELQQLAHQEVHDFRRSSVERLAAMVDKAEDPFYRPKTFPTEIAEGDDHYKVKITLPPYEARDVMVSGFSNQLKLTFSRDYEANTEMSGTHENATRHHLSVTDTYYLPTNLNFKRVHREYEDGVFTITIAKANPVHFVIPELEKTHIS